MQLLAFPQRRLCHMQRGHVVDDDQDGGLVAPVKRCAGAVGDEFGAVQAHIAYRGQPPAFPFAEESAASLAQGFVMFGVDEFKILVAEEVGRGFGREQRHRRRIGEHDPPLALDHDRVR